MSSLIRFQLFAVTTEHVAAEVVGPSGERLTVSTGSKQAARDQLLNKMRTR